MSEKKSVAALLAAGYSVRPGPEWKSAAEWAEASNLPINTARSRAEKLVRDGSWERILGRPTYYRMKP